MRGKDSSTREEGKGNTSGVKLTGSEVRKYLVKEKRKLRMPCLGTTKKD